MLKLRLINLLLLHKQTIGNKKSWFFTSKKINK